MLIIIDIYLIPNLKKINKFLKGLLFASGLLTYTLLYLFFLVFYSLKKTYIKIYQSILNF